MTFVWLAVGSIDMGLIKNIVGGIFGLIGGIFGSIAKIFGVGKQGEFYMELDEAAPSVANVVNQVVADEPTPDAAAPVVVTPPAGQGQPALASFKEQIPAAPKAAPAQAAAFVETKMPEIANFATDYLVNPRTNFSPRRRPGPSLSPFKDMAKNVGRRSTSMG
jgi:hypothetical protein